MNPPRADLVDVAARPVSARPAPAAAATPRTGLRIFLTVGTELPFDRLVHTVDEWAFERNCAHLVDAQIGERAQPPKHIRWTSMLDGDDYSSFFDTTDLIVAHAGMGTIIGALEAARPLIVMPRSACLGEHRNDHQFATVARLEELGLVTVANNQRELTHLLDRAADGYEAVRPNPPIGRYADTELLTAIRSAITPD